MKLTKDSQFTVTVIKTSDHAKAGDVFHPKGLYWHKKNLIIVGDISTSYPVRLSLPADSVEVNVV